MSVTNLKLTDAAPLLNSVSIPRLGFGSYLSTASQCIVSCVEALKAGYRHIDTAQYYENEKEVGEAVRQSGIPRSKIFITTKILKAEGSVEDSYQSLLNSVQAIDGEDGYVDLFLIHNASVGTGPRKELWLALEKLYKMGKTKSIGVSNYGNWTHRGDEGICFSMASACQPIGGASSSQVSKVSLIIQLHPWCQQKEIVEYCRSQGIVLEAYSPLVRNERADNATVKSIAKSHYVSGAQVLIRYSLQKDWIPLPKSDTPFQDRCKCGCL